MFNRILFIYKIAKDEMLTLAVRWKKLEGIIQSERCQKGRDKYWIIASMSAVSGEKKTDG